MSNNLDLTQVTENQANPEVPVNDKGAELDAALTETVEIDLTSDATVTAANYRRCIRLLVSTSGTSKTLTLQAIKRLIVVDNTSANDITVALGTSTITLAGNTNGVFYTDGTANGLSQISAGVGGGGSQPFDVAFNFNGSPEASQKVLVLEVVRAFTWPSGLSGSIFKVATNPTATTTFTIKQNGTSIGSLAFGTSGTCTVTFSSAVTFSVNDEITIEAPATPDATLAGLAMTILGSRS